MITDWSSRTVVVECVSLLVEGWLLGGRSSVIEHWQLKQQGVPAQD